MGVMNSITHFSDRPPSQIAHNEKDRCKPAEERRRPCTWPLPAFLAIVQPEESIRIFFS